MKVLQALAHCHVGGVAHRDIKPENVMIGSDGEIKLIDFGLSKVHDNKSASMKTIAGTPYYMAPEVINGSYNKECDVWSAGVLLYLLLTGLLPFYAKGRMEQFEKITSGKYNKDAKGLANKSKEVKDLLSRMLVVDVRARISA